MTVENLRMARADKEPKEIIKDSFFQDGKINNEVLRFWAAIFKASNEIIRQSNYYGFLSIAVIPDPNIHQILKALKVIDDILDEVLSDIGDSDEIDAVESVRLIENAKKQLSTMEGLALSLRRNDEASYNEYLECLKRQAPF